MVTAAERQRVLILAACQALLLTAAVLAMTLGALVGHALAADKSLATLPIAASVIGTALASAAASFAIERYGWRSGFLLGTAFGAAGGLLAACATAVHSFWLFVTGYFLTGAYQAFGNFYRFAAAESVAREYKPQAVSWTLAGGGWWRRWPARRSSNGSGPRPPRGSSATPISPKRRGPRSRGRLARLPAHAATRQGTARAATRRAAVAGHPAPTGRGGRDQWCRDRLRRHDPRHDRRAARDGPASSFGRDGNLRDSGARPRHVRAFVHHRRPHPARRCATRHGSRDAAHRRARGDRRVSGLERLHFVSALVLLGVGWNFLYIGGTTLLTEAYRPEERARTQAANDLVVFGWWPRPRSLPAGSCITSAGGR